MSHQVPTRKITVTEIAEKKRRGERIVMLTAYDYPTGRALDEAGVDMILVGDSLGMVVGGLDSTLPVTMDMMIYHTRMVARGRRRSLLVGDMPYMSYHVNQSKAVENAARFVQDGGAEAVKIEGGRKRISTIRAILAAEIPVMGHIGLTPQSINVMGGYKVQGRTKGPAQKLIDDALHLEDTGVFSIVLEGVPAELAAEITSRLAIPTIGIGAGRGCDGQVLVIHDLLGFTDKPMAKFVRVYRNYFVDIQKAVAEFRADVENGSFPADQESYHMAPGQELGGDPLRIASSGGRG
ncbi:MAG: 3-methyl-2-oxobutanoate hydroxymethyltransferase [Acidobacteria bacterium]|nr:3-methyl-2-oxobutanoate hydroxymethyltransferase [Acidobacteriota bacterium]